MKIEEVIKQLESILDHVCSMAASPDADEIWKEDSDALEFAISALRSTPHPCKPLTLEQLRERWKGCDSCKAACWNCSHNLLCRASNDEKCHNCFDQSRWEYNNYRNYCPECGRPLTDGAWVQLAKRLEGLKDAKAD